MEIKKHFKKKFDYLLRTFSDFKADNIQNSIEDIQSAIRAKNKKQNSIEDIQSALLAKNDEQRKNKKLTETHILAKDFKASNIQEATAPKKHEPSIEKLIATKVPAKMLEDFSARLPVISSVDKEAAKMLADMQISNPYKSSVDREAEKMLADMQISNSNKTSVDMEAEKMLADMQVSNSNKTSVDMEAEKFWRETYS